MKVETFYTKDIRKVPQGSILLERCYLPSEGASYYFLVPDESSTGGGETTDTNRVLEAGVVKEFQLVKKLLWTSYHDREWYLIPEIIKTVEDLIQKYEGSDKG